VPRPVDPRTPAASWTYRMAAWVAFTVMRLQRWRFEVRGIEHLPRLGGAVIAANHTSYWDFFTVGRAPYLWWGRPVRILAKESLFRAPVFGRLMRAAEHIPVHRGAGARALRSAVTALRGGELVLVLPEQTISPSFELLPYKSGAARMAATAGVPLVPAVSWGSHRFHTAARGPRWSWRLPVTIAYGEPLTPAPDADPAEVTAELQRRSQALLEQVQADYRDGHPAGAWWVPARLGGGAPTAAEAEAHLERLTERWRRAAGVRVEQAKEAVHEGAEVARERLHEGAEQLRESAEHARERLHDGAELARERLHDGAEHVKEGAGQLREGAEHLVERVQEQATQRRDDGTAEDGNPSAGSPPPPAERTG
jgi:1-acyl-sn-glycerol-3-phosphate acyltransferase